MSNAIQIKMWNLTQTAHAKVLQIIATHVTTLLGVRQLQITFQINRPKPPTGGLAVMRQLTRSDQRKGKK